MIELLSPAGSFEAMRAAVCNGADAVYLGYGDFNARRNAKNFNVEALTEYINILSPPCAIFIFLPACNYTENVIK